MRCVRSICSARYVRYVRAVGSEAQLRSEVKELSNRLEQQAELLARQAHAARTAAYESAQAAATQVSRLRGVDVVHLCR